MDFAHDNLRGDPSMRDAALAYTRCGWAVVLLHTIIHSTCSCGNPSCTSPGKHPRTAHGVKDATTDEVTIHGWGPQWPEANIGIATGAISGLVVLDVDPRHGGDESLKQWRTHYGPDFLHTLTSRTGGGGCHLLYRHPGVPIINRVRIAPGLDIRGDGGYIVAPPSRHISGQQYRWTSDTPLLANVADLPTWLLARMTTPSPAPHPPSTDGSPCIPEGERNNTLTSLAGTMQRRGFSQDAMAAALLLENEHRCIPPLAEDEVWCIVRSIARYEPGPLSTPQSLSAQPFHIDYLTDLGNARRLVARHGLDLRFCPPWAQWFCWNGTLWVRDADGEVIRRAKETVESIYEEAASVQGQSELHKALLQHAEWSQAEPQLRAMSTLAESEPGIPVLPEHLDADPWLFNCRNGTLDLRTGTLQASRRADLITKVAPVAYDPDATCPLWRAFLDRIMRGNAVVIAFLQRVVGYALTGDIREQCLFLLYGTGANGKSTFLEVLRALLGDYAQQTDFTTFLTCHSDGVRNDLARLRGARCVSAVEVESGRRLDEALIKQVTGGDTITARFLYQEYFQFVPQFKLFLAANHKPVIFGTDHAMWRRIRLIPFTVTLAKPEQDKNLFAKLRAEFPGILAWAVQGCLAWQREGLEAPEEVEVATEEYREEMDPVGGFLEDCCLEDPHAKVSTQALYAAFTCWCLRSGEPVLHQKRFSMRLGERGYLKVRFGNSRGWAGLKLKNDWDALTEQLPALRGTRSHR